MVTCQDRLLVLVPHQDDELNIAGQILPFFIEEGYECRICFSTNGDGFRSNGPIRLHEAMEVADCLGVGRDNVIMLGFDDSLGPDHPYNRISEESKGAAPLTTTYSDRVKCYSAQRSGRHLPQCRETLLSDISHLLFSWLPRVIVCVDYDSHPDHRALSLAFESALDAVMRENADYRPLVLKKFAYSSLWYGPADYYTFSPTVKPRLSSLGALDNPMYAWEDRVCVAPHSSTITRSFFSNAVVGAAKRYKSQNAWWNMISVCNSDVVYWVRRTDDVVFDSEIEASSGDPSILQSFLLFDSADVCSDDAGSLAGRCFQFDKDDDQRRISVRFDKPSNIANVFLRESIGAFGLLDDIIVRIDSEAAYRMERSAVHPGRFELSLESPVFARELSFCVGTAPDASGIASVEAYPVCLDDYEPLKTFRGLMGDPVDMCPSRMRLERVLWQVARVTRKIENIKLKWREKVN